MTEKDLLNKLRDPFYFISRVLKANMTNDQNRIIESVWSNKYTEVKSSHAIGKTHVAASIILAYLIPFRDTIILSTAPSKSQVEDLLWSEIRDFVRRCDYNLGGKLTTAKYQFGPKWFAKGISVQIGKEEKSAVNFQGYHQGRVLVVIDEACGVHSAIWEAIDGITSNEEARVLAIGNPSMINVPFHRNVKDSKWNVLTVSAFSHPNVQAKKELVKGAVSYDWVKEKVKEWCKEVSEHDALNQTFEFEGKIYLPNNLFLWKVLGEFPRGNEEGLFQILHIKEAMHKKPIKDLDFCHLGIDVARFGEDDTVFTVNHGNNIIQQSYHGLDVVQVADQAVEWIIAVRPSKVAVDCDGLGAGVYDILKRKRDNHEIFVINEKGEKEYIDFMLISIQSGRKPLDFVMGKKVSNRFLNIRAQMYWQLRQDLIKIKIPNDETLEEELLSIDYETKNGVISVTKKEDLKATLGRSPDKMDSLIYCAWLKYVREKRLQALNAI